MYEELSGQFDILKSKIYICTKYTVKKEVTGGRSKDNLFKKECLEKE
jgi:hypothetical protein